MAEIEEFAGLVESTAPLPPLATPPAPAPAPDVEPDEEKPGPSQPPSNPASASATESACHSSPATSSPFAEVEVPTATRPAVERAMSPPFAEVEVLTATRPAVESATSPPFAAVEVLTATRPDSHFPKPLRNAHSGVTEAAAKRLLGLSPVAIKITQLCQVAAEAAH